MARSKRMQGFIKRGDTWHIRTDPVTGKQMSTGCKDTEAALLWRAERERLAANPAYAAAQKETLSTWVSKFLESKKGGKPAEGTIQFWESKLGHLGRILGDDRRLSTIDPNLIDAYVKQRRSEPGHYGNVSDYTIARELRGLIGVLKFAKRRGCYPGDLQALMPEDLNGKYTPKERALDETEVVKFLEAMPTIKWASLVALCIAIGCRLSEGFRLTSEDIDLETGVVWIDGKKTPGSDRTLPIISGFRPLLVAAMPQLPIGEISNVSRTFAIAAKRAGIERCSPNDLRRTHSTLLGKRGLPDDLVARLLGHQTTSMAKRVYNRAKAIELAPVAEKLLATAEPLTLPGEAVQICDSDRKKLKLTRKNGT